MSLASKNLADDIWDYVTRLVLDPAQELVIDAAGVSYLASRASLHRVTEISAASSEKHKASEDSSQYFSAVRTLLMRCGKNLENLLMCEP